MAKPKKPVVLLITFNHPELLPLLGTQCPKLRAVDAPAWFFNPDRPNKVYERHAEQAIPEEEGPAFAALSAFGHAASARLREHIGDTFKKGYHPNATLSDVEASFRADGFEPVMLAADPRKAPRPAPKWGPISKESPRRRLDALVQLRVLNAPDNLACVVEALGKIGIDLGNFASPDVGSRTIGNDLDIGKVREL